MFRLMRRLPWQIARELTLVPALAVACLSIFSQRVSAGSNDGWVARFFWSPQYCHLNRGSREPQCVPLQGFVLRDLIHVVDGVAIDNCQTGPIQMTPTILDQMTRFTRNRAEAKASWRIYGRCSGLSEVDYASWAEFVDRRIAWPETYKAGGPTIVTDAVAIAETISRTNPGLDLKTLVLQCKNAYLESVDLCLDSEFKYSPSSCPLSNTCKDEVKIRTQR